MWNIEFCDWNVWQTTKNSEGKAIDENNASDN